MRKLSYYDPKTYPAGVPNPFGVMYHAWHGGELNQGTRYHGPVYGRSMSRLDFTRRPLWGTDTLGQTEATGVKASTAWMIGIGMLGVGFVAGYIVGQVMHADAVEWGER